MRTILVAGTALLLAACVGAVGTGRLQGDRSLSNTAHGYTIVSDVVRAGAQAQRFEVRSGDCASDRWSSWNDCDNDRERSEISLERRWAYGTDMWIGFSVYLPENFETSSRVRTTVGQIHQRGGPSGVAGGLPSRPPLMQLEMLGNRYFLNLHVLSGASANVQTDDVRFDLIDVADMRGKWTDVVINFNTANGEELIEAYVNGQLRARYENWIEFVPDDYSFKYGIYRSFVSRHGGPMPIQVLYIDEVRMGTSMQSVVVNEQRPVD